MFMMSFIDHSARFAPGRLLRAWLPACAFFAVLAFAALPAGPVYGAQTKLQTQLMGKSYLLEGPLLLGRGPRLVLQKGILGFPVKETTPLIRSGPPPLPANWPLFFKTAKARHIEVMHGQLVLDLRTGQPKTDAPLLQHLLNGSDVAKISLSECDLLILTDVRAPISLEIKSAVFSVDLEDGEIEGGGTAAFWGAESAFQLGHSFKPDLKGPPDAKDPADENGQASKTRDRKIANTISPLQLKIQTPYFDWMFEGETSGRKGLTLKGESRLQLFDAAGLMARLLPSEAEAPDAGGAEPDADAEASNASKTDKNHKPVRGDPPIIIAASGLLDWSGARGTLSEGAFDIGGNSGSGTLKLKLTERNHALSGTLAFETIVVPPLSEAPDDEENRTLFQKLSSSGFFAGLSALFDVEAGIRKLVRLVRGIDVDLRVSAETVRLGQLQLSETGFSLYQSKGEAIIDVADVSLFGGQAGGHMKIDTRAPKPRWHVNLNLLDVEFGKIASLFKTDRLPTGVGRVKFHLTSFGDKLTEIYQNMTGGFGFQMNEGGKLGLNLALLTGSEEHEEPVNMQTLQQGDLEFSRFTATGRIEPGRLIAEHAAAHTDTHDFTGKGFLNFEHGEMDYHIASWAKLLTNQAAEPGENKKAAGAVLQGAPLLLSCSRINGPIATPSLEVLTALRLSLLNRGCPAFYHPPKKQ